MIFSLIMQTYYGFHPQFGQEDVRNGQLTFYVVQNARLHLLIERVYRF